MNPLTTYLVETFITLVVVIAIAFIALVGAKRLGFGRPHGPLRIVGRLPLDARRSIYLVQVADQVLILGASEGGITKLGELAASEVGTPEESAPKPAFADLLSNLRRKDLRGKELLGKRAAPIHAPNKAGCSNKADFHKANDEAHDEANDEANDEPDDEACDEAHDKSDHE